MHFQVSLAAIAVSIFALFPSTSAADSSNFGTTVHFNACSSEQISLLEKGSIVNSTELKSTDFTWIEMHSVRYRARREMKKETAKECGAYPFTIFGDTFFVRFKGMCQEGYCYTFIFDGFGVKTGVTSEPFHYFGLTRGEFQRASEKTDIESFYTPGLAFPFGVSYWVDFAASGRIKFMLPPISRRS